MNASWLFQRNQNPWKDTCGPDCATGLSLCPAPSWQPVAHRRTSVTPPHTKTLWGFSETLHQRAACRATLNNLCRGGTSELAHMSNHPNPQRSGPIQWDHTPPPRCPRMHSHLIYSRICITKHPHLSTGIQLCSVRSTFRWQWDAQVSPGLRWESGQTWKRGDLELRWSVRRSGMDVAQTVT